MQGGFVIPVEDCFAVGEQAQKELFRSKVRSALIPPGIDLEPADIGWRPVDINREKANVGAISQAYFLDFGVVGFDRGIRFSCPVREAGGAITFLLHLEPDLRVCSLPVGSNKITLAEFLRHSMGAGQ